MRKTLQCPKCDGRKLWRVEHAATPGLQAGGRGPSPVGIAVVGSVWRGFKALGGYETFTCAACGYTEWYAHGVESLEENAKEGVHFIDTEPEGGLR